MKQAILIRKDLGLPKGKIAAIAAHLAVDGILHSEKKIIDEWRKLPHKIILGVENENALIGFSKQAAEEGLVVVAIAYHESEDGKTEKGRVEGRTEKRENGVIIIDSYGTQALPISGVIGLSIGPNAERKIDKITKDLKLYKF